MGIFKGFARAALVVGATLAMASCGGGGGGSASSSGGSSTGGGSTSSGGGAVTSRISIDHSRIGQLISGWEVTPRFWEFDKANDRYNGAWLTSRDAIVQKLVDDAGINRVRVELRSGVENPVDYWTPFVNGTLSYNGSRNHYYEKINDNSNASSANAAGFQWASFDYYVDNFVVPLKTKVAQSGQSLFVTLCLVDFDSGLPQGSLSLASSPNEYAELITLAAQRLQSKGITLNALEVILEPDNGVGWSGSAIANTMLAAKSRLAAAGFTPKFIAPSASRASITASIMNSFEGVAGASAALNTVSYHRYDGDTSANGALATIRQRASNVGADTAMLEYVNASTANFFRDMEFGGASAWQGYGAADDAASASAAKDGYILWSNPSGALALTPQFSQIAAIQRKVKSGARVHYSAATQGSDASLDFQNPDGSEVIAIYSTSGSTAEISGAAHTAYGVTFAGPNGAAYTTSTATASGTGRITITIPANTVVVLHSTN